MPDHRRSHASRLLLASALLLAACTGGGDPEPVASNCDDPDGCSAQPQPLERIDTVDILLVVDDSGSIAPKAGALKQQLPRLLNAIVNGSDDDASFPPASSVHVAVASSDMGALAATDIDHCAGLGDDGVFVRPGSSELSCETSYPGYLSFEGGPAAVATVDTVDCVPLLGMDGCGFEQPLEAGLKALWPGADDTVTFIGDQDGVGRTGHGDAENAGFLRENSLLVVVVVSDEDDCSANYPRVFTPATALDPSSPDDQELLGEGLNVRCTHDEYLYNVQRYIAGFAALRAEHPDRVIFAAIAGIPPELVPPAAPAMSELSDDEREAAYDALLEHDLMKPTILDNGTPDPADDTLQPSCNTVNGLAYPPVRLVKVARGFGSRGVLGSICDDFGDTTGMLVRAIGERLTAAANGPADAGVAVARANGK